MEQRRVSAPLAERGVYWALANKGGRPQAFCVDSRGEEVERLILDNDSWTHAEQVIEYLWHALDAADPIVTTKLVLLNPAPMPSTVKRNVPDNYDPYAEAPPIPGKWRQPW